jgi:hypothetical protein
MNVSTLISQEFHRENFVWPGQQDWWESMRWVLLVFTLVVALTLIGSFVSYQEVVAHGHPWLPHRVCPGCPLCGMTRSFCAMSSGRFMEAVRWNRGGPALYVTFWLWLLSAALMCLRMNAGKLREKRRRSSVLPG